MGFTSTITTPNLGGGYQQRYNDVMGMLGTYGNQTLADIQKWYQAALGQARQQMTSSGFTGSTVPSSVYSGITRQQADALARASEQIAQQKAGFMSQFSGDTLGYQERAANTGNQQALAWANLAMQQPRMMAQGMGGYAGPSWGFQDNTPPMNLVGGFGGWSA